MTATQTHMPDTCILRGLLRKYLIAFGVCASLLAATTAPAVEDMPDARDHPLLSRYPDSHITEYSKNYNALEVVVGAKGGKAERQSIEGDATIIRYFYNDAGKQPSALQLIRNYQNAIRNIGGEVIYERLPKGSDSGETTLKVTTGGKEIWVRVRPDIFGVPAQSYELSIVETAAMQQAVTANKLLDELNKNGFIALYINFDTGKSELKADGQATVREIVSMLKSAPSIRIAIEGHTDNAGKPAANKTLSENRARSVMTAIIAGGIDKGRLSASGFGQENPIADNRTEQGRAKNRRVELVKK
ncbi:MAG: OmpA family protein [Burkholderiales bacterium]